MNGAWFFLLLRGFFKIYRSANIIITNSDQNSSFLLKKNIIKSIFCLYIRNQVVQTSQSVMSFIPISMNSKVMSFTFYSLNYIINSLKEESDWQTKLLIHIVSRKIYKHFSKSKNRCFFFIVLFFLYYYNILYCYLFTLFFYFIIFLYRIGSNHIS